MSLCDEKIHVPFGPPEKIHVPLLCSKYLGKDDQLVEYFKPKQRPRWMSKEEYDALPDSVIVRELRRRVRGPAGNRVTLTIVTTLTDPDLYPAEDLVALRLRRWDVETNLRHLKTTMGMDVLRCK